MTTVGLPSAAVANRLGLRPFFSHYTTAIRQHRQALRIKCSAESVPESADTEEWSGGGGSALASESPVGASTRTSSLISADNVQKALRGIAITDADHYGRLGIPRGTPYDEVAIAYKRKCEELMNQELEEVDSNRQLLLLKESYEILSSEEERRLYDWSLSRSENPDRYLWPFQVDITQTPTQTPPPSEPEDVGPTRLVGYFFLTWLILSFVLSVTLNR